MHKNRQVIYALGGPITHLASITRPSPPPSQSTSQGFGALAPAPACGDSETVLNASPPVAPVTRARGAVMLSAKAATPITRRATDTGPASRVPSTVLRGLRQSGSLKCVFPHGSDESLQAILVNTAGGITGGDRFETTASVETGSCLTLSTQAAERAYRAQPGQRGRVDVHLKVAAGARLNWLPQETILFEGCALDRRLTIDLEAEESETPGVLLMAEPLVFGRLAMGETVRNGSFRDRIEIRRDGRPLYLDSANWHGDLQAQLDRPGVGNGARALASVVYVAPDAEARLDNLRAMLPETGGASLLADDVLVLRLLAEDSFFLRAALVPVLTFLSPQGLPRSWTL